MDQSCGGCRYFRESQRREDGRIGHCRIERVIGVIRDSRRACGDFSVKGEPGLPSSTGAAMGRKGRSGVQVAPLKMPPEALAEALTGMRPAVLKAVLVGALRGVTTWGEEALVRAWAGGTLTLCPADSESASKALPLDQFFHKIVMVRDALRVLEQKLNSHKLLYDSERVDLHRRLSMCHEALVCMAKGWLPPVRGEGPVGAAEEALAGLFEEVRWELLTLPAPPLADRWVGGQAVFEAGGAEVREPIEAFFRRIAQLRDRLVCMEALISAHPHIAADEADAMSNYIRRCHGSLTTFNVLMGNRADYFSSSR